MYGIAITHNSAGYKSDPKAGTKQAANTFSWDGHVTHNQCEDVNWECYDDHGGYDTEISYNWAYNTPMCIMIGQSSGDAIGYDGANNEVIGNHCYASNQDGTISGRENKGTGIIVNGGTTVGHTNVKVIHNTVVGFGVVNNSNAGNGCISYSAAGPVVISENTVEGCGSNGIGTNLDPPIAGSKDVLADNVCLDRAPTDTSGNCFADLGSTRLTTYSHNKVSANGRSAMAVGLRAPNLNGKPSLVANDFSSAATQLIFPSPDFFSGLR
jgi:hypothetical protein